MSVSARYPTLPVPAPAPTLAPADRAGLLTCSFRGDLAVCRLLCRSVDRFVDPAIRHLLLVPRRDLPLFAELASGRRTVHPLEDLMPWWLREVPLPSPVWRRRLALPRRDLFVTPFGPPVRGWIAQQIFKMIAAGNAEWEVTVHVDSDVAFIRPLGLDRLVAGDKVRFYRAPGAGDLPSHRPWHGAAAKLLGLPDPGYFGADYIDNGPVWRRSTVRALGDRIAAVTGRAWEKSLARTLHFSEYILYGVFADHVLGADAAGHAPTDRSLCLSQWDGDLSTERARTAFLDRLAPDQVGLGAQSTLPLSEADRVALWEAAVARAADQDRHPEAQP